MKTTCRIFVVLYTYPMKTTLNFNFHFYQAFKQHGRIHINIEKLSINNFSLFTCKLVIWKKLYRNLKHEYKSRLHCTDIIADHCILLTVFLEEVLTGEADMVVADLRYFFWYLLYFFNVKRANRYTGCHNKHGN